MEPKTSKALAELLKKAQAGNSHSLQVLCKELERGVRGYFWHKFRDEHVVDDLCQETYLRFLNNILRIKNADKLKSFVAKVALHVMQEYFREKEHLKEVELEISFEGQSKNDSNFKPEIIEMFGNFKNDHNILSKVDLDKAFSKISEQSRQILLLKIQGYKYEEISHKTGLSISGVKMQIKRTVEQLRNILF